MPDSTFLKIAMNMIRRGVAVVPTYPGLRYPALNNWPALATIHPGVVELWATGEYSAFNCCSVAKFNGVFMLDIDNLAAAKHLDVPELPKTLAVKTPGG